MATIPLMNTLRFLFLATLILVGGCTDLASVRKFASLSETAAGYTGVATDYPKSVTRLGVYAPPGQQSSFEKREQLRENQAEALLAMHKVVAEYMGSLGQLASDDTVKFDKPAASLSGGLKATGIVSEKEASAAKSIITVVGRAAVDRYRRAQIAKLIEDSNGDLQIVLGCLENFAAKDYPASLADERAAINSAYDEVFSGLADTSPGTLLILRENYAAKKEALKKRGLEAKAYAEIIGKIKAAHQKLYDGRNDLASKQLTTDMAEYSKLLNDALTSLKAIGKG